MDIYIAQRRVLTNSTAQYNDYNKMQKKERKKNTTKNTQTNKNEVNA